MTKTTKIILGIVIVVVALILVVFFYSQKQKEEGVIRIGSIQALTGETARFGLNVKRGIDLAVEDINNAGGINGKRLEIIHEDSQCDQKRGVSAAKKLIEIDKVSVILGPTCSSVAMAVASVAEEAKVIMFTSVASVPALKYAGDYIFRNSWSGEAHGIKMAEFAVNALNAKTASTLYINLANGIGYKDSFKERFEELGGKVLNSEAYDRGASDFRDQLLKIKDKNPDVIFMAGQACENAVKQARELSIEGQIIGPITMEAQELLEVAGEAAEGIYYSYTSFDPDSTEPVVAQYQQRYVKKYGKQSEAFAANGYDAVMLNADALEKCGYDTACIRDYLYSIRDYRGVSGITTFDEFGDAVKPLIIKTVKNGEFVRYSENN